MRIVAGRWKGRRINPPAGTRTRPTADRVREAWMSIVGPLLPGARVLDLFAGSGALGLEALSRGAEFADFVEVSHGSLRALHRNIELLGAGDETRVHRGDALKFARKLQPESYDIAFGDPPYEMGLARQLVELWLETRFARVLSVEHSVREDVPEGRSRRYGDTLITVYGYGGELAESR